MNKKFTLDFASDGQLKQTQEWTPELLAEACAHARTCIMFLWGCPFSPKAKVKGCSYVTEEDWANFLKAEEADDAQD